MNAEISVVKIHFWGEHPPTYFGSVGWSLRFLETSAGEKNGESSKWALMRDFYMQIMQLPSGYD